MDFALWNLAALAAFFIKGLCGFANTLVFTTILSFSPAINRNISPVELLLGYPTNLILAWRERRAIRWRVCLPLAGLVMAGSVPGALLGAYVSRVTGDSHAFKANICVVFLVENTFRVALYTAWGILTPAALRQAVLLVPAMLLGLGLGIVSGRLLNERRVKQAVVVMLMLSGGALLFNNL